MSIIDGVPVTTLGPWGLVSTFFLLVFLGGLVPRWIHNQRVQDKDVQIEYLRSMVDKRDEQFDKLLKQGELNTRLLEDLKAASKSSAGSGHP